MEMPGKDQPSGTTQQILDDQAQSQSQTTTNPEKEVAKQQGLHFDVFLDFDGTIVKENTIPWMNHLRQDPSAPEYQEFLEAYIKDYTHLNTLQGPAAQRKTVRQEYDYLESLVLVEEASIKRIENSGWLKGVRWSRNDTSVFDNAVAKVISDHDIQWRSGLDDLCGYVLDHSRGRVAIISVHWSEQFIRALLRSRHWNHLRSDIHIYCNEIDPQGSGCFSRHVKLLSCPRPGVQRRVWSPHEKAQYTSRELEHLWTAFDKATFLWLKGRTGRLEDSLVVYVGDSKTDLHCLMDADIGIRMIDCDEEASLSEILDRLHIRQLPIDRLVTDYVHHNLVEAKDLNPDEPGSSTDLVREQSARQIIWVAQDFVQIEKALKAFAEANVQNDLKFYKPSNPPESLCQDRRPSFTEGPRRDSGVDGEKK